MAKIKPVIEKINLATTPFGGGSINPKCINFFYGKNATGKTTISRVIDPKSGIGQSDDLTWQEGKSADDVDILVYNQDFVREHFRADVELPGVFTLGKENISLQDEIVRKTEKKSDWDASIAQNTATKTQQEKQLQTVQAAFREKSWDLCKEVRTQFPDSLTGFKNDKKKFADQVLQQTHPTKHDGEALETLYKTVSNPNAKSYALLQPISDRPNDSPLLGKSITSSGDSPFAEFIKAIQATDWVRRGHEGFRNAADGKCPYCQQKLPPDFETDLASCFDEGYQADVDALDVFQKKYKHITQNIMDGLEKNQQNDFHRNDLSKNDFAMYDEKVPRLKAMIETNCRRIAEKIKEPSLEVSLEDINPLLGEINAIIEKINASIRKNNEIVRQQEAKKEECRQQVWEQIAFICQTDVKEYTKNCEDLTKAINGLTAKIAKNEKEAQTLEHEIAKLNRQVTSVQPTIDSINKRLEKSGFQRFSLRENPDQLCFGWKRSEKPCGTNSQSQRRGGKSHPGGIRSCNDTVVSTQRRVALFPR